MNANDVSQVIIAQIGGRESLLNSHGLDLRQCLAMPTLINVMHRCVENSQLQVSTEPVWLVLEERPSEKDGYKIIFNEQRKMFGLASTGFSDDPLPVVCGYYGDFLTTLASM